MASVAVSHSSEDPQKERRCLEKALTTRDLDFSATYMAVGDLHALSRNRPQLVTWETISVLRQVLTAKKHSAQTQAFFLYREAASALAAVAVQAPDPRLGAQALLSLQDVAAANSGPPRRAAAEAMGSLPLRICGPRLQQEPLRETPRASWEMLLAESGIAAGNGVALLGRSLVLRDKGKQRLLVVKLARAGHQPRAIRKEALWMEHLCSPQYRFPVRFDIPRALRIKGGFLFRLQDRPTLLPAAMNLHPEGYAVAFLAHPDYFFYANHNPAPGGPGKEEFAEVMWRNAWLLGSLASRGIVHCAPIALFHNRVQQNRRNDQGAYQWQRAGRLDRWLYSCRYPNLGLTGIRDFEHFTSFQGPGQELYHHIGSQILSLILVGGSYFRNRDPQRLGLDAHGRPVDARELFDGAFFEELISGLFHSYYHGFVGHHFSGNVPLDFSRLTARLIEELGVDRHMEEILRVADQREMTRAEFRAFLRERGYPEEKIDTLKKGAEDITILTGPHLGGFNQPISLPELIDFVATASALCLAGRYWQLKSLQSAA